jgi:hypothetical protein
MAMSAPCASEPVDVTIAIRGERDSVSDRRPLYRRPLYRRPLHRRPLHRRSCADDPAQAILYNGRRAEKAEPSLGRGEEHR